MNIIEGHLKKEPEREKTFLRSPTVFQSPPLYVHAERLPVWKTWTENYRYSAERGLLCAMTGYFSNLEELKTRFGLREKATDLELLESSYLSLGKALFPLLDGMFTALICDFKKNSFFVFQSECGDSLPFYYAEAGGLVFGNSLKRLLKNGGIARNMDLSAAGDFLYETREIPNEKTLIKGVCKLVPGTFLEADTRNASFRIGKITRPVRKTSLSEARSKLLGSVGETVSRLAESLAGEKAGAALSSGFDTNLILYFLDKTGKRRITAVTVGGSKVNEIPASARCAMEYPRVEHRHKTIDKSSLDEFPYIVWVTEGYLFERGLFLAKELPPLLAHGGVKAVFLGDGADQQLQPYSSFGKEMGRRELYRRIKSTLAGKLFYLSTKGHPSSHPYYRMVRHLKSKDWKITYDATIDYIIKKSGMFLNAFGIQPVYPFLNYDTKKFSAALGGSAREKSFYKKEIKKILPGKAAKLVAKAPGSTDIEYLFEGREDLVSAILRKEIPGELFSKKQLAEIYGNRHFYLDLILHLLYLHIFSELFVSGKYDDLLETALPDMKTEEFL